MKALLGALALLILLAACARDIQNKDAVRDGVMAHLKTRTDIDLSHMTVDVTAVSFRRDEADATVSFRPAGTNDPGGAMAITYTLEQKGGKWVVKGRKSAGGESPHGAAPPSGLPPGHPPASPPPARPKP